jgi:acetate---CoA ligase (ADP-forming)
VASFRSDLAPFINPASAVVLGASDRNSAARQLVHNLRRGGCRVTGTHPTNRDLLGAPVVARVADLTELPAIACVALGAANITAAVNDALDIGIRHFVVPGLGPEAGSDGAAARRELAELCRAYDANMVGPNGMGIVAPGGASAWIGSVLDSVRPGRVGVLAESGSIGEALIGMGPRVGFRAIVSSGNEIAGDSADWLAWYANDHDTETIGLFLETVRRPAAFAEALALAAQAQKPVVVLKVATSTVGAERALAHSGAIAGSDRAFDALCRAYGVVRSADYGDWVETLEVFGSGRRPRGRRIVIITNSGGEGEHAADAADAAGIPLVPLPADLASRLDRDWEFHGAANPLDYYAFADEAVILPVVTGAVAAHPQIDGVVLNIDQSLRFVGNEGRRGHLAAAVAADVAADTGAFVAIMSTGTADAADAVTTRCAEAGVPLLIGAGPAMRAVAAAAAWRPRLPNTPPRILAPSSRRAVAIAEADSKALLAEHGLVAPREARCVGADAAISAATEIGYPVVVKADGPAHKERVGGVFLGCATPDQVRRAVDACGGRVLVAEELRGGVEVLVGVVRDDAYGAIVVCGVGGAWAEATRESARTALVPVGLEDAAALVRSVTPLARRLDDAGVGAAARALVSLSDAAARDDRIREIDVNPLRVVGADAVALDALVVREES